MFSFSSDNDIMSIKGFMVIGVEYVRKTVDSKIFEGLLDLPKGLKDRKVEVIILPFDDGSGNNAGNSAENGAGKKKSADGIFSQYANPSLVPLEQDAWGLAVEEKYENR
jgi:hypothetical protein